MMRGLNNAHITVGLVHQSLELHVSLLVYFNSEFDPGLANYDFPGPAARNANLKSSEFTRL